LLIDPELFLLFVSTVTNWICINVTLSLCHVLQNFIITLFLPRNPHGHERVLKEEEEDIISDVFR